MERKHVAAGAVILALIIGAIVVLPVDHSIKIQTNPYVYENGTNVLTDTMGAASNHYTIWKVNSPDQLDGWDYVGEADNVRVMDLTALLPGDYVIEATETWADGTLSKVQVPYTVEPKVPNKVPIPYVTT